MTSKQATSGQMCLHDGELKQVITAAFCSPQPLKCRLQALQELAPVVGTLCVRITVAGSDGTVTDLQV